MENKEYYMAYEDRYQQIHGRGLRWFSQIPSQIVGSVMSRYGISKVSRLLEIGCGEGRDAFALLTQGYDLLATDISEAAIAYCRRELPEYAGSFQTMDCVREAMEDRFDFIYAVAVVHMLVLDEHRYGFYQFLRQHLKEKGIALICSMGDGKTQRSSDIRTAFDLQERVHEESGQRVQIAGTSYRAVCFEAFEAEIRRNGLQILEMGTTSIEPDYYQTMYAVVTGRKNTFQKKEEI